VPADDLLAWHLARHAAGEQVVGGAIAFGRRPYLQLADNVSAFHDRLPNRAGGPQTFLFSANLSVRRAAAEHVGPMLPRHNRAEDLEWSARLRELGYSLYFEPRAIVYHDPARYSPAQVWRHWSNDAPPTLAVRLKYAALLRTPRLASRRWAYLWGAPLVAAWATARVFAFRPTLAAYWHTLPVVYLTKLAWCWGAFRHFPGPGENACCQP
jgi:GT2 family glycosyltransferase